METYIVGVMVAFLHKIIDVILYIILFNSKKTKNYEKIGFFLDYTGSKYNAYQPPELNSIIMNILFSLFISPLGSWITVFSFYTMWAYGKYKKFLEPYNINKFNKAMSSKDLNLEEINMLIKKFKINEK